MELFQISDTQCQMFLIQDGIWGENVFSQTYFFLNQKRLVSVVLTPSSLDF